MRTLTLLVDGMRCRRCVRRATALVRHVGVQAVKVGGKSGCSQSSELRRSN